MIAQDTSADPSATIGGSWSVVGEGYLFGGLAYFYIYKRTA